MGIKLENIKIVNCGTGIVADGNVDIEMKKVNCEGNKADIRLNVTKDSNISISDFDSIDCENESILINEYTIIDEVIKEVEESSKNKKETKKLVLKLKQLQENFNNPKVVQRILLEIYSISKAIGMPLFIQYLKNKLGIQ